MSFREITAKFRCDGCNAPMEVEIDPAASNAPAACAESQLADGFDRINDGFSSVQDGQHLCGRCTHIVDEHVNDDSRDATYEEIQAALDAVEAGL